jgi:hypothetical protein
MRGTLKVAYEPIALLGRTKLLLRERHFTNGCARKRGRNEDCILKILDTASNKIKKIHEQKGLTRRWEMKQKNKTKVGAGKAAVPLKRGPAKVGGTSQSEEKTTISQHDYHTLPSILQFFSWCPSRPAAYWLVAWNLACGGNGNTTAYSCLRHHCPASCHVTMVR